MDIITQYDDSSLEVKRETTATVGIYTVADIKALIETCQSDIAALNDKIVFYETLLVKTEDFNLRGSKKNPN